MSYNITKPLATWEDATFIKVGPVSDPQDKARAIALFPKSDPESRAHAMLFKQVVYKWRSENAKNLKNQPEYDSVQTGDKTNV